MSLRSIALASAALLAGTPALADQIEVNLSNDTAMVQYATPLNYSGYGRTDAEFGALYTETDDLLGSVGIAMVGEAGSQAPGLAFGLSIKAYAVVLDATDSTLGAVTLGGRVQLIPPGANRLIFSAYLNYAPDITSFGDADKFMDMGLRAEYEILPDASAYIGYRKITAELDGGVDADLDDAGHVGVRISF